MTQCRTGFKVTKGPDNLDRSKYRGIADRLSDAICKSALDVLKEFGLGEFYRGDASAEEIKVLCDRIVGQIFRSEYNRKVRPVFNGAGMDFRKRLSRLKLGEASAINDRYFRGDGVMFHIYALVSSKTGNNLPGVKAGFTKSVSKIPREVEGDLAKPDLVKAEEAASKGELWFIKVGSDKAGEGWRWRDKNGAAKVSDVHDVLVWLLRFASKQTVDGAKAFYIEINNNFLGL